MGFSLKHLTDILNPMNVSIDGNSAADVLTKTLPKSKNFNVNAVSAMEHPLSFATGGLLGGKGGTFEVPHFGGGSTTNALSGSDQYGNSANKNRAIAAIIGTVLGGEALAGGDSTAASPTVTSGAEDYAGGYTAAPAANTPLPAGGMTATGDLPASYGNAVDAANPTVADPTVLNSTPSLMSQIGSGLKNYGPLALSAINMMKGSNPTDAQNQQGAISAEQKAVGDQLVAQYQSGQLNAGDAYNLAQWDEQQSQSTKDYYDKAGLGDSSMAQQALAGVHAQSAAMRAQALQNYLSSGMSALGNASNTLTPIISAQIAADQRAQQVQSDFFKALASMNTTGK